MQERPTQPKGHDEYEREGTAVIGYETDSCKGHTIDHN